MTVLGKLCSVLLSMESQGLRNLYQYGMRIVNSWNLVGVLFGHQYEIIVG